MALPHIISSNVMFILCEIVSYYVMLWNIISYHIVSCHVILYHVISCGHVLTSMKRFEPWRGEERGEMMFCSVPLCCIVVLCYVVLCCVVLCSI